jgi:Reverse transcriptase (RNA-dependent DNA polymerase)
MKLGFTQLPKNKKLVGCKWVFKIKYNSDGNIKRYKARLMIKGYTQTYGIDYQEIFTPVANMNTIIIFFFTSGKSKLNIIPIRCKIYISSRSSWSRGVHNYTTQSQKKVQS